MYSIIPLAGPDCYHEEYGIRPLLKVEGEPLVKKAITSRSWYKSGDLKNQHMIFVLRESADRGYLQKKLQEYFPGSKTVTISQCTSGALLSALAGSSLIEDFEAPIAIDLVDILYDSHFCPRDMFRGDSELLGIVPYFESDNEKYSYLQLYGDELINAVEKKVISSQASAGTYFFRNLPTLLDAISKTLRNPERYHYKNLLFVCPSMKTLVSRGKVKGVPVKVDQEISLQFH